MKHYDTSFFCEENGVIANIYPIYSGIAPTKDGWPITLGLNSGYANYNKPSITLHFKNESQYIEFVNSVKSSYEEYRREKGYK